MIPGQNGDSIPEGHGNALFHVVVDTFNRVF